MLTLIDNGQDDEFLSGMETGAMVARTSSELEWLWWFSHALDEDYGDGFRAGYWTVRSN